jgi:hypothetical protein
VICEIAVRGIGKKELMRDFWLTKGQGINDRERMKVDTRSRERQARKRLRGWEWLTGGLWRQKSEEFWVVDTEAGK